MYRELLKVALRQQAIYLPPKKNSSPDATCSAGTMTLVYEMRQLGFTFTEELLRAVNQLTVDEQAALTDVINDVMGTKLNWASLVRGWQVPTGETVWDHFLTLIANIYAEQGAQIPGTVLPCGHLIPEGTFPLERYNGCPYCGKPFRTADFVYRGQGDHLRLLHLWGDEEIDSFARDLLLSPVALDATQRDSLKILVHERHDQMKVFFPQIQMKETRMLVIDELVAQGCDDEAAMLFGTPADVMRYLWYRQTGKVQIIEPRTLLHTHRKNQQYERYSDETIDEKVLERKQELRLKYDRPWCRRVARWLNMLTGDGRQQQQCLETMHPKREMWVRFIRALRLAEYAKKPGYEGLRVLMDRFYRQDYDVWQGQLDRYRHQQQTDEVLRLLKQRPGLFARCLFATLLRFDKEQVLRAFREVLPQVAPRLLISLGGQAPAYFNPKHQRVVRPITGVMKKIGVHPLVYSFPEDQLKALQDDVINLYGEAMRQHFANMDHQEGAIVYIDPALYNIPVPVGDRSSAVQDISAALQGTRFPIEGDQVRLFMQWGKDLPAQHLDMDLSCYILTDSESEQCAYFNLNPKGAKHSGDIQEIPDMVGAAEYVELSLPELEGRGARRVVFTCNAYTPGEVSPNVMVGWMNAESPMEVDDETGVAYDPSTVQHMVRVPDDNLSKGIIFGVLEVEKREIIWLEIPFDGQTVLSINPETIEAYLYQLSLKPTIGQILQIKAEAQHLRQVEAPDGADEAYTLEWAHNTAVVSGLLVNG